MQPSRGVLKKRCSEVMQQIYSSFIEITLWHGCSPVNLLPIFRTPFSKNTSYYPDVKRNQKSHFVKTSYDCVIRFVLSFEFISVCKSIRTVKYTEFWGLHCIKWYNLWNIGTSEEVYWILLKRLRLVKLISLDAYIFALSSLLIAGA